MGCHLFGAKQYMTQRCIIAIWTTGNTSEICIKIQQFASTKMNLKTINNQNIFRQQGE